MRGIGKIVSLTVWAVAAATLPLPASSALAQSLNTWSLQPSSPTSSTPSAEGPVDPQNPVVQPAAPASSGTPKAPPAPVVSATPPPATATTPAAPRPRETATESAVPASSPDATEQQTPDALRSQAPRPVEASVPKPVGVASEAVTSPDLPLTVVATPGRSSWPGWWLAIPAVLAILILSFLLTRRRSQPAESGWDEPLQEESTVASEPVPMPTITAALPAAVPPPIPVLLSETLQIAGNPAPELARARGQLDFQPVALRLSLVYATLQFRLLLTAQTEIPEGRLLGDMISAHGSLSQVAQLQPSPEELVPLQRIPRLAPGQVYEVKGDLRLPLNAIRPVKQGEASFMVPLVRLAMLGDGETSPHLELGCVFTVGLPSNGPALAPIRLDTGPRDHARLAAREIEDARRTSLFALDPARAAG